MSQSRFVKIIDYFIIGLFFILLVGTPLLFTSYTRSVFEVNKLLLLRLVIMATYGFWLLKAIYEKNNTPQETEKDPKNFSILGFKWKKIGLEKGILLVLITNILSTIFSQDIRLSIIGAYDRWEGILTVINYLMLYMMFAKLVVNRRYLYWILAGLVIPAGLSAVYGIYQSVGWDFMRWSVNPALRVFACINNPVHFCAYLAMIVPVGIAWLCYYSSKDHAPTPRFTAKYAKFIQGSILSLSILFIHVPKEVFRSVDTVSFFDAPLLVNASYIFLQRLYYLVAESLITLFTTPNLAVIFLLAIGFAISLSAKSLFPSLRDGIKWTAYLVTLLLCYTLGWVDLSQAQWVSFGLMTLCFYMLAPLPDIPSTVKRSILVFTAVVFYAVFLSFSRATWIGFMGAGSLFFMMIAGLLDERSEKRFMKDFFLTLLAQGAFLLFTVFHIEKVSPIAGGFVIISLLAYILYSYHVTNLNQSKITKENGLEILAYSSLLYLGFLFNFESVLPFYAALGLKLFLVGVFLKVCSSVRNKKFLGRLIIMVIFVSIQSMIVSILSMIGYTGLVIAFYLVVLNPAKDMGREIKLWLLLLPIIFGLSFALPSIPYYISKITPQQENSQGIQSLKLARFRASSYENEAQNKTARGSMWKSAVPWIIDYPLIGSGLDTIKYMYPVYRRADYGILEGGHNFTPDRLHNEYINTLATKGLLGFLAYYGAFILPWIFILLKGYYRIRHHRYRYLIASFLTGGLIYLGQVLFNFGVVATLVLFYILMAVGHAMSVHPSFVSPQEALPLKDDHE